MRRLLVSALAIVSLVSVGLLAASDAKPATPPAKGEKPLRISLGQKVDLAAYVVPGKTTIFDFTSEFCPPCRAIAPKLEKLHSNRDDIVVVAVDINRPGFKGIDFKSPVAAQYGLHSIPHFKIYGPDGKLKVEDTASSHAGYETVLKWVK
jgi:thiol-disulfide isomerase/thioredoxin